MAATIEHVAQAISAGPYIERRSRHRFVNKQVLGGRFRFESDSEALLDLVESAYGNLLPHRLPDSDAEFHITLRCVSDRSLMGAAEPPSARMHCDAGVMCAVMDACNYVVVQPAQQRALVVTSADMLGFSYHLRYELIECAVFLLATHGLGLVPLHGACVGREGRGMLLFGASGAGKSTLALHGLLEGLDFIAEDAVFVEPERLLATGVANYIHMTSDALRFIDDERARHWICASPIIRRRSGIEKFEADVRRSHGKIAATPQAVVGAVFVSSQPAGDSDTLLVPVAGSEIAARLRFEQPYAASRPEWARFEQKLVDMGMYELRRGSHPRASIDALRCLLDRYVP